jgi:hypothetical protein
MIRLFYLLSGSKLLLCLRVARLEPLEQEETPPRHIRHAHPELGPVKPRQDFNSVLRIRIRIDLVLLDADLAAMKLI